MVRKEMEAEEDSGKIGGEEDMEEVGEGVVVVGDYGVWG